MPVARVAPASSTAELPHSSTSVRQARNQLAAALCERDVLGSLVDDAVLILSEFVTNSLRHARPLESGAIRVFWELRADGVLRIEVTDGGGTTRPATKPYSMSVSSQAGRGLEIVDRLADRWGSQREEGGEQYTVWAELTLWARHANRRPGHRPAGGARVTALPTTPVDDDDAVDGSDALTKRPRQSAASSAPTASVIHLLPPYPQR